MDEQNRISIHRHTTVFRHARTPLGDVDLRRDRQLEESVERERRITIYSIYYHRHGRLPERLIDALKEFEKATPEELAEMVAKMATTPAAKPANQLTTIEHCDRPSKSVSRCDFCRRETRTGTRLCWKCKTKVNLSYYHCCASCGLVRRKKHCHHWLVRGEVSFCGACSRTILATQASPGNDAASSTTHAQTTAQPQDQAEPQLEAMAS